MKQQDNLGRHDIKSHPSGNQLDEHTRVVLKNLIPRDIRYLSEMDHLESIGKNFPNGSLFRCHIETNKLKDPKPELWLKHIYLSYASPSWERISNIPFSGNLHDFSQLLTNIYPVDKMNTFPSLYTPLNGIAGLLNILAEDTHLPESIREHIEGINNNSRQLVQIIEDTLDAAKIEAGQMSIHPQPVCIDSLMDEMYATFTHYLQSIHKTHIRLENHRDGNAGSCIVYADPVRLKQILFQLLNNAAKFTEQGYIRIGYRLQENNMLAFFVEDTGIGIPENQLENIFLLFRQLELGNNRRYGGTGLGLPIALGLVKLMGGDFHVTSTLGVGSIFSFTINCPPCEVV